MCQLIHGCVFLLFQPMILMFIPNVLPLQFGQLLLCCELLCEDSLVDLGELLDEVILLFFPVFDVG